jgi:hypothetical protein
MQVKSLDFNRHDDNANPKWQIDTTLKRIKEKLNYLDIPLDKKIFLTAHHEFI